jgi:hypothetical protein
MPQCQQTITEATPIVGVIEVIQAGPTGVTAIVGGQRQAFPDLDAVFRAAVRLLDEKTPPHARPAPSLRPLPGFAP